MVKRLCLSSTVEVAVSPDALSLSPGLTPLSSFSLFLYLTRAFSSPPTIPPASFTFYILLPHHRLPTQHLFLTSLYLPLLPFSKISFSFSALLFFSVDCFFSLKGETLLPCTQQVMPPLSYHQIVSMLPMCWCNVDIIRKDSIDLGCGHEEVVYGQCLWFPEERACGDKE